MMALLFWTSLNFVVSRNSSSVILQHNGDQDYYKRGKGCSILIQQRTVNGVRG